MEGCTCIGSLQSTLGIVQAAVICRAGIHRGSWTMVSEALLDVKSDSGSRLAGLCLPEEVAFSLVEEVMLARDEMHLNVAKSAAGTVLPDLRSNSTQIDMQRIASQLLCGDTEHTRSLQRVFSRCTALESRIEVIRTTLQQLLIVARRISTLCSVEEWGKARDLVMTSQSMHLLRTCHGLLCSCLAVMETAGDRAHSDCLQSSSSS